MSWSLSPSIDVIENDLSAYTPNNLPSAKTGFVVRAEKGYANKVLPFTSEGDLLALLGKPTATNYMDWYNCWNFAQYASSGYLVRPMNKTVKNAGVALVGSSSENTILGNLYNPEVAELTLQDDVNPSKRLSFYNRYVTATQDIGLSVCSSSAYWEAPIANEFFGIVTRDGSTVATINDIGGDNLSDGEITMTGISLVAGSKFILNGNKLATVKNVYADKILTNTALIPGDISVFYGTVGTGVTVAASGSTTIVFDDTKRFDIAVNSIFVFSSTLYKVTAITGFSVTVTPVTTGASTVLTAGTELHSNTEYNFFTPTTDYVVNTNFVIPIGTTTIKVEPGFNFPVGNFLKLLRNTVYTGLATDSYPEESGTAIDNYEIVAIDIVNNTITLDRGLEVQATFPVATALDDVVTIATAIRGINLYSTIFDDSIIMKTPVYVTDVVTGDVVFINKESLVTFRQLLEFQPNWVQDEFVTIVLQKNSVGKYTIMEKQVASYRPDARDYQNRNLFANEVFYYGSKLVYCKVTETETNPKVNTAEGSTVKFVSDFGSGTTSAYVYGTVYPLAKDDIGVVIDPITTKGTYDPNEYSVGDIQNAAMAFADAETFDVNILVAHTLDINGASTIAETRKDCIAIVAPYDYRGLVGYSASEATQTLCELFGTQTVYANKLFTAFGTYSSIYGNMKYQYDKFNDVNRWMCISGDIAGIYAQTDKNRDPWWAPAGLDRGKIKNVIKLAFNANKQNRDELYINAINPIISIVGEGAGIIFGQKTATANPSALDRVNVRRLMIVIEKAIATAVRWGLFEFNDNFTRNRLVGIIQPYLRMVKARRGVYWFDVVCDERNNTSIIIDNNGLVIDVYVQPTKVAEMIQVNFNILGQSANISEIVGKNVG